MVARSLLMSWLRQGWWIAVCFTMLAIARPVTSSLTAPVRLRNALCELVFLLWCEVVDVNAVEQSFSVYRLQYLLLHILRVNRRGTQQTAQRWLVLHLRRIGVVLSHALLR
jgi:hypothetical protein